MAPTYMTNTTAHAQKQGAHSNTDSLSSSDVNGWASVGCTARKARWSPVNITCAQHLA